METIEELREKVEQVCFGSYRIPQQGIAELNVSGETAFPTA